MHGKAFEVVSLLMKRLGDEGFSSRTLGKLRLLKATNDGRITIGIPVEVQHLNLVKGLHGGVTASIVDVAGSLAIACKTQSLHTGVSTDISVSYLSGGKLGDELRIEAECPKAGRTLAFTQVRIFTGDKLLATGSHTKFIAQPSKPSSSE
ncbi:hypothetical protein HK105_205930 [Polyrhizophydium stewartii]|uniref:Thioesterase domain-containing protein n=1 Tax=Polyrhizophydium stewartii TaxID=2732419 RepID=A0ABR4N534_9FUNG